MDQRERAEIDREEGLLTAMDGRMARVWTALPALVISYDPDEMTVVAKPTIQAEYRGPDGAAKFVSMPLLLDCPVVFPSGGNVIFTFPIATGDECLVVFASRCIDAWWQSGAIQPPAEFRMHDLSDGFVFVGPRSLPKALLNVSTTTAQLRSKTGETFIELDPATQEVTITAPGGATLNADVTINGTLHVTGQITCDADVVADGVSLKTHTHGGVTAGGANTGAPN